MNVESLFHQTWLKFLNTILPNALDLVAFFAPLVGAVLMAKIFWILWLEYIQSKNILSKKFTLLELKLPKDTWKSPKAMEIFINSLHNGSDGSNYNRFWKGEFRPWYSLELISIEGVVKFLIWTEDNRKAGVMSALYSQFPEMEIKEVPDYTKSVHFDPKELKTWACEMAYTNKKDAYPIKTYIDYGLEKDPKEEFKVDPLLPLIEFLGSVGPNQQIWIQILIQAHVTKNRRKSGKFFEFEDGWKEDAKKELNEILIRDPKTKISGSKDEATGFTKLPSITEVEKEIATAIERRISKPAFDVGIRCIYIAKKDIYNAPFGIGGTVSNFKHFGHEHMNGFKPNSDKFHPKIGEPWTDFRDIRRNRYSKNSLLAYKRRSYFHPPFVSKPLVMNSEELATIYHFPGSVAQTPNLERVPSKRSQAPGNLPV